MYVDNNRRIKGGHEARDHRRYKCTYRRVGDGGDKDVD